MRFFIPLVAVACVSGAAMADRIELANGVKYEGLVVSKTDQYVEFKIMRPSGNMIVRLSAGNVVSLEITGKGPQFAPPAPPKPPAAASQPSGEPDATEQEHAADTGPTVKAQAAPAAPPVAPPGAKTATEIEVVINAVGSTAPDWWDSVNLDYPKTLDLGGRNRVQGWQPQKNIGAYFWSVVTPNPPRWRPGIKLLHHVLSVRRTDAEMLAEGMNMLAEKYRQYEKDWARAAFWHRKALEKGAQPGAFQLVGLAECYWHLGSKAMAADLLKRYQLDRMAFGASIKLWAEMGETQLALDLTAALTRGGEPDAGQFMAGNIYRTLGQDDSALACYQAVAGLKTGSRRLAQYKTRASECLQAMKLQRAMNLRNVADGTYSADSVGYRGPVTVQVVVVGGKITSAKVTRHREDIYYTSITDVPADIVRKQSLTGIDAVTGATVTSEAIMNAAAKALAKGVK